MVFGRKSQYNQMPGGFPGYDEDEYSPMWDMPSEDIGQEPHRTEGESVGTMNTNRE